MIDRLAHRGHVRGHDGRLHRHRFKQRPRQHEGHGQVDVAAAELHHLAEGGIGHPADEMDPAPVHRIAQLLGQLGAQTAGVVALAAIGDIVAADHHHPRRRAGGKDLRQGAHEDVKAARMFEVARHVGEHLVLAGQCPAQPLQRQRRIRVGAQEIGADAVMADIEPLVKTFGKEILLPLGRHMAQIHAFDAGERHRVAGVVDEGRVVRNRLVGVEAHQAALHAVEVFEEAQHRHIRPDLLHEQKLAPAGMPHHQVGTEALVALQRAGGHGRAKAGPGGLFPDLRQPVGAFGGLVMGGIDPRGHPRQSRRVAPLGKKDDPVPALRHQPFQQLAILARHVLVNEENIHHAPSSSAAK